MPTSDEITSAGARELVDLSADAVGALGLHLKQIGGLISKSALPPKKGERGTAWKVKEKYDQYMVYCEDVARRKKEMQDKMKEDLRRLQEWRKEAGTEGASMVEEIEKLYEYTRQLKGHIADDKRQIFESRQKIQRLLPVMKRKDDKLSHVSECYVKLTRSSETERYKRAILSSWLQCSYAEIRYRWSAEQEKKNLLIEHHRRMRKKVAQGRIDVIGRERTRRLLQMCLLSFQEEAVESRAERLLEELRSQQEDQLLVLNAQLAQCLGDDENAKELIAEQVRRLEGAKQKAIELEKQVKLVQRESKQWKAKSEELADELSKTKDLLAETTARAERAEADAEAVRKQFAMERAEKEQALQDLADTQEQLRKAEEMVRKRQKKIEYLKAQLMELGADSDSDAPPDEREPSFFLNKDGAKEPRPRTRKERANMAKREAETARFELRLGIAAMVDKDLGNTDTIKGLKEDLEVSQREVQEVRWSNKVLCDEAELTAIAIERERQTWAFSSASQSSAAASSSRFGALAQSSLAQSSLIQSSLDSSATTRLPDTSLDEFSMHSPSPSPPVVPFSPSSAATTPFSTTRPAFVPAAHGGESPRVLLARPASQPALHSALYSGDLAVPTAPTEPLAPLRKVKKSFVADFKPTWH